MKSWLCSGCLSSWVLICLVFFSFQTKVSEVNQHFEVVEFKWWLCWCVQVWHCERSVLQNFALLWHKVVENLYGFWWQTRACWNKSNETGKDLSQRIKGRCVCVCLCVMFLCLWVESKLRTDPNLQQEVGTLRWTWTLLPLFVCW